MSGVPDRALPAYAAVRRQGRRHPPGACVAPFATADGHYNPGGVAHRDHAPGDLPVLFIDADGEAEARSATDRFALGDLFDDDRSAFILHANADNYAQHPVVPYGGPIGATLDTGDAGARIACGVVTSDRRARDD